MSDRRSEPPAERAAVDAPIDGLLVRRRPAILAGLCILATIARAGPMLESLWYDELFAWIDYAGRGPAHLLTTYLDPVNHVLASLLTWASVELLGPILPVELAMRAPALVASLLLVLAQWALVRRMAGVRAALLAAALVAVLPVAVLEGAEARGYAWMMAAAAGSTWAMLGLLEGGRAGGPRAVVVYGVVTALGIWAHPVTAMIPAGHALVLVARLLRRELDRRAVRSALAAGGLAAGLTAAAYAPIAGDLVELARAIGGGEDADRPGLAGRAGLGLALGLGGSWTWWAALPGLVLGGLGLIAARGRPRAWSGLGLALAGLPILVGLVAASGTFVYARFGCFALPGAAAAMAIGLERLWSRAPAAGLAGLAAVVAASAADLALRPPRQPLREAAALVEAADPGARVLVVTIAHPVLDVYRGSLETITTNGLGRELETDLRDLAPAGPPPWAVVLYPRSLAPGTRETLEGLGYEEVTRLPGWVDGGNGAVVVLKR